MAASCGVEGVVEAANNNYNTAIVLSKNREGRLLITDFEKISDKQFADYTSKGELHTVIASGSYRSRRMPGRMVSRQCRVLYIHSL